MYRIDIHYAVLRFKVHFCMPEQNQNQDPPARKPAIRTMEHDLAEIRKSGTASLASVMDSRGPAPALVPAAPKKRVLIPALTIFIILALLGTVGFFLRSMLLPAPQTGTSHTPTDERALRTAAPAPYFAAETSRAITVKKQDRAGFLRLMNDTWGEREREGTMKRIVITVRDGPQERFATVEDFFELWRVALPERILQEADPNLMVFFHAGPAGNRMGFATRVRDPDRTFAAMLRWEQSLLQDASRFFFDEKTDILVAPFEDRTWRNIDWRYLKLSPSSDLGIAYAIFPVNNILVFTTSKSAMETAINRLFDAR